MTITSAGTVAPQRRWSRMLHQNEFGLLILLVLVTLVAALTLPGFRTSSNISEIFTDSSLVIVVAVGEAVVIMARQIDLSVGAILGLSAYLVGSAVGHIGFAGPLVGVLMALLLGAALGLFNGLLIVRVRMPAIIATLATLSIFSGLQDVVTHGSQLYAFQLPGWLAHLETSNVLGIGAFIWIAAACVLVVGALVRFTRWGRDVYALGSSPEAAQYLGISASRRTYQAFAVCGALAGLGGLMYASRYGNVDATAGSGFELTVIAAAVIGGVSLFGGSGSPLGAALGAILLFELESALALLKISIFAQQTLQGAAIVIAVAVYSLFSKRLRRPAASRHRMGLGPAGPTAGSGGAQSHIEPLGLAAERGLP
jgi:rhamnose transport system permease protein